MLLTQGANPFEQPFLSNTDDFFEEWNEITPQIHIRKFEELMA